MAASTDTASRTLTLTIPAELAVALDRAAAVSDRTRAEVLVAMLRAHIGHELTPSLIDPASLAEHDSTWPTFIGIVDGLPVFSDDFDDWLDEHRQPGDDWRRP